MISGLDITDSKNSLAVVVPGNTEEMIMRLMDVTNLEYNIAKECLEMNSWNYSQALANFLEVSSSLPPSAYKNTFWK